MDIRLHSFELVDASALTPSFRCPACRREGTFNKVVGHDVAVHRPVDGSIRPDRIVMGQRSCPNPKCKAHAFIVAVNGELVRTYPPETIDFDSTNLPTEVVGAFEEAVKCHANECYVAAAIMIRKTLEVLCEDRKAQGTSLRERIAALGSSVVMPKDLLSGLDDLRLLGNDAAHVEAKTFAQVSRAELEAAFEFTKEVLKAVYQYSALLAKLKALKETPA